MDELTVGWIGAGTMGRPMATQVLGAGAVLRVHDVADGATDSLVAAGATDHGSPADAASGTDITCLSLPGPPEIIAAVTGQNGVLAAHTRPRAIVDLSTNSPSVVRELRDRCAELDVAFVDAPVSGGVGRAETGTLSVMVGAAPDELELVRPVLDAIGRDVFHVGTSGSGTIAKLVNNQLFLAAGVAVQEAYVLGAALGMAPTELHTVLSASSAGPYAKLAPLLLGRAFDDVVFRLDIAAKDLRLAIETADDVGADVPLTRAAGTVYDAAVEHGDGELVFHATLRELERRAGVELGALRRPERS